MTLPASGTITISDINEAIGQAPTYSSDLSFLNGLILPALRPSTPNLSAFYSLNYYQNNTQGNCNNGNCTSNCNCGNIQCTNCYIAGTVNCTNCDSQQWLQTGANCACTYNCTTGQVSYNCNCACACSKIICAKLYEFGLMDENIWAADQAYGRWLHKKDRRVYRGYIRWARIVTAWMDGKGPNFLPWIKNDADRFAAQKAAITKMAIRIGTPWSEHMAFLMGAKKQDNLRGKVLMEIGKPICRLIDHIPRNRKKDRKHHIAVLYTMWALFYISDWTATAVVFANELLSKTKARLMRIA